MQLLSTWIQTLSAPVFLVFRKLHGWTGNVLLALFLLALFVHLIVFLLHAIAPGRWFVARKRQEEEVLEAHRSSFTPEEYERQKALISARTTPKWGAWASLFILIFTPLLQWYSVFALYGGLFTSTELRGVPFAWTPDVTSRDPRHILTFVAAGLLVLGLLNALVKKLTRSAEPGPRAAQLRASLVIAVVVELLPLAIPVYGLCLFVAGKVLPFLMMLLAIPLLTVYKILSRPFRRR